MEAWQIACGRAPRCPGRSATSATPMAAPWRCRRLRAGPTAGSRCCRVRRRTFLTAGATIIGVVALLYMTRTDKISRC